MNPLKKLICGIAVCLCVCTALCNAQSGEKSVRVGLYYGANAISKSVKITSPTGFIAGTASDGVITQQTKTSVTSGNVAISSSGTLYFDGAAESDITYLSTATEGSREQLLFDLGAQSTNAFYAQADKKLYLMPVQANDTLAYIEIGGKKYPEVLEFTIDANGKIKVINIVGLEQYLKGVLPNEVYPSWEPEALKAAAVATRTYTLKSMRGKHASHDFDLCTTTDCQVYGGVTKIASGTNDAADATFGQVLKYNGALAETVYHAISGGTTESANGAWGSNAELFPYLSVVQTPFENYQNIPNGTWSHAITPDELFKTVSTRYPGKLSGYISGIDCETDGGAYIHRMTISDSKGNSIFLKTSSAVRSLFGKYALSANFTIARTFMPSTSLSNSTLHVMTSNGVQSVPLTGGILYKTANSQNRLYGINEIWYLSGKGYGHGVGMSQYGAQHAALLGYTYDEILNTYYPGTQLCSMYD